MPRPNGCHDRRPIADQVIVQDGWRSTTRNGFLSREPNMVAVPFRMTPDCQYTHTDLGKADKGCTRCKHRAEAAS